MTKKKGKAPAFQFYASDFYMDTISWTDEMVGMHIRLMSQQWINDFIEIDDAGYPLNFNENKRAVFDKIKHKYFAEKNGFLKNKKLDKVKKEKVEFIKKATKSGKDGASRRWGTLCQPYKGNDSENIALLSSSSSSTSINKNTAAATPENEFEKLDQNGKAIYEMFRRSLDRIKFNDSVVVVEVIKFQNKYHGIMVKNSGALVNKWCSNIGLYKAPGTAIVNHVTGKEIYV